MLPLASDYDEMAKFSQWAARHIPDCETAALDCALLDALVRMRDTRPTAGVGYLWEGWKNALRDFKEKLDRPFPVQASRVSNPVWPTPEFMAAYELVLLLERPLRGIVWAHAVCGYTLAEIAERRGMTRGQAKRRYDKGLKVLRQHARH
jgi:DNA-directed RNA polymerase specialized sigma24 family protein